jgi:Podovirus DNA encapsidation protein (Gp16)
MNMSLPALDTSIYYNYHTLLSHNALFNFIIGNRGAGKTYGFKKWAIKTFLKSGAQFIYLRRYKTEFDDFKNFFGDIAHEFPDCEFEVKGKLLYINGELAGYGIALSTALSKKSVSYHLVDKIGFDEFVIDKGHLRYLSNEVTMLLEFYETVARMRENVRLCFISNAVSVVNPYFLYWNLRPNPKKRFTKKGHLLIEFVKDQDFIEAKYKTKFGQIIKGTKYGNYAVENEFLKDNDTFVEKKTGNARFEFSITYMEHTYGFWTDYKAGLCFVSYDYDPSSQLHYAITDAEHKPNMMLITSARKSHLLSGAIRAYEGGWLRFEDMQIKNQTIEMFQMLGSR